MKDNKLGWEAVFLCRQRPLRAVAGRLLVFFLAVGSIFRRDDKLDQLLPKRTHESVRGVA